MNYSMTKLNLDSTRMALKKVEKLSMKCPKLIDKVKLLETSNMIMSPRIHGYLS